MKSSDVCIATVSWARNPEEEKILRASLEQLALLALPVYITDGGSSESFLRFLKGLPRFRILQAKGLWPQARTSIREAQRDGAEFIFYTEPDKQEFFSYHLQKMLETVTTEEKTGVVLASRSAKGLDSFPLFQQMTETTINRCCAEIIGKEVDYCYGPFLFNSQLLPFLQALTDHSGWGWRPFVFAIAHRLGLSVESYQGDFTCPSDQRQDNAQERIYRMKQLTQNINGIIEAAAINLLQ